MKRIPWIRIVITAVLLFLLAACGSAGNEGNEPIVDQTPIIPPPDPTTNLEEDTMGMVVIEALEVAVLESFPGQVQAAVSGNLSDACTEIASINAPQSGQTFQIQIETTRDPEMMCAQVLEPFAETITLETAGLPAGTYTVLAGDLSESFTMTADNEIIDPTPELLGATLIVSVTSAVPGQSVQLTGTDYPANASVEIGIGPPESEYDVIAMAQVDANGRLNTQVDIPDYVDTGEWVFVADVQNAKVIADPIMITASSTATPDPSLGDGVNEPVNGEFTRTYIYLIAVDDAGQSGELIGCNDSVIPVVVEIEPTIAPLTAALETLLSIDDQYYGQSGLYNALYQSDLSVEDVDIDNSEAIIHLTGNLQLGGVCDNPRIQAQLEQTALQYDTVDSVMITVNGEPLEALLSGQ